MALAQAGVAFDNTVTTTFGEGLTQRSAVGTVSSQGLAQWGAVGTIGSQGLTLWGTIRTVLSDQAFFFQAIVTTFSQGLALWSTVGTISGNRLAEHRGGGFDLWGGLFCGWQGESGAGQH